MDIAVLEENSCFPYESLIKGVVNYGMCACDRPEGFGMFVKYSDGYPMCSNTVAVYVCYNKVVVSVSHAIENICINSSVL